MVNVAFFCGKSTGDRTWFATALQRDLALDCLRERAIARGLSVSAARAGIYAVDARWARVRGVSGVGHRLDESLAYVD